MVLGWVARQICVVGLLELLGLFRAIIERWMGFIVILNGIKHTHTHREREGERERERERATIEIFGLSYLSFICTNIIHMYTIIIIQEKSRISLSL